LFFPTVPSQLSYTGCPASSILFQSPISSWPVLVFMFLRHVFSLLFPVWTVMFRLSCTRCPVPSVRSRLFCPSCPVLPVLSQLFCCRYPVPAVMS
jgi:hypothetical protein